MGIFQQLVTLVNRAPVALTGRFDGQDIALTPGENHVPAVAVDYIKNQNPIMGSVDADNPTIYGGEYLVGLKGVDNCEPLTEEEWNTHLGKPSRVNIDEFIIANLGPHEKLVIGGRKTGTQAKSLFDKGVRGAMSSDLAERT